MIWTSVPIMTFLDLAIVGMAGGMLIIAARKGLLGSRSPAVMCLVAAMMVIATFYVVDLIIMHVSARLVGRGEAMRLMQSLHLEAAWIVTPVFVALLFCAFLSYVTERNRGERRVSLLGDALPVAICYVDSTERITYANRLCAEWRQQELADIVGGHLRELLSPEDYSIVAPHTRKALNGGDVDFEGQISLEYSSLPRRLHIRLAPDRDRDGDVRGFYALMTDITEQIALEREVVNASERERVSIGQTLHDNLGQTLTGASLKLQALARSLARRDSGDAQAVAAIKATVQKSIEETRDLARLLAPAFDSGGLEAALESLAREASQLFGIECTTECVGVDVTLNTDTVTHVYRIAQESLTNAVRHGRPSRVHIRCFAAANRFRIEIVDDGSGIPLRASERSGMGISTMRYRARMLGGELKVGPRRRGGTRVVCSFLTAGHEADGRPPTIPSIADISSRMDDSDREAPGSGDAPSGSARSTSAAGSA